MSMIYLSIHLSICLFVCLAVCPSVFLTVYLSVFLVVCLAVCLTVYLSASLSVYMSVGLFVRLLSFCCLSVRLSGCPSCVSVLPYLYVSIHLSIKSMETLQNPQLPVYCVCDAVPLHSLSLQEDHFRDSVFLRSVCDRRRLGAGHLAGGPGPGPWESGL